MNIPRHIDFRSAGVRQQQTIRDLDAYPWAPRQTINLRGLASGTLAAILIAAFLYGLLMVGAA